jgi:fumarylpyruvate hydrolase
MIWSVPEQITILSTYFELKAGDLIFSGTPEGVGAVTRGDVMNVAIATLGNIELRVV